MLSEDKCVMFEWDNSLSNRHIASELNRYNIASDPTKNIARDELKNEHIIWGRTP